MIQEKKKVRNSLSSQEKDLREEMFGDTIYSMSELLKKADRNIESICYCPASQMPETHRDIVSISYLSGLRKFLDISNISTPFGVMRTVCNSMDDFCVEEQFMNPRELAEVEKDLRMLFMHERILPKDQYSTEQPTQEVELEF